MENYASYAVNISLEIIKEANEFKFKSKKKKISAQDAIGYTTSIKKGVKFLNLSKPEISVL